MKKLLLGLGTIAAVAAPVATVVGCQIFGKWKKDEQQGTSKITLKTGQDIYAVKFTIGVTATDLISDKSSQPTLKPTADFITSLGKAGIPKQFQKVTPTTEAGFAGTIDGYINFICTSGTPGADNVETLIEKQLELGGIPKSAFISVDSKAHYKKVTSVAKSKNENFDGEGYNTINNLEAIKFVTAGK